MYHIFIHLFICWQTVRWLPCLGCRKQCCSEQWGHMSFELEHTHTHTSRWWSSVLTSRVRSSKWVFSPGETWPQEEGSASCLWLPFLCREQLAVPLLLAQKYREVWLVLADSRDRGKCSFLLRETLYPSVIPHSLPSQCRGHHLNNGSALAPVLGLASTRTFSSGSYAENIQGPSCFLCV